MQEAVRQVFVLNQIGVADMVLPEHCSYNVRKFNHIVWLCMSIKLALREAIA